MAILGRKYLHKKSGHIVKVMDIARLQTTNSTPYLEDMEWMVIYIHGLNTWIRSEKEFDDGRFELIKDA